MKSGKQNNTDEFLDCLVNDVDKISGDDNIVRCKSLKSVAEQLIAQKKMLETLPSSVQPKKKASKKLSKA